MKAFRFRGDLERDDAQVAKLWALGCSAVQQDGAEVVGYFAEPVDVPLDGRWERVDDTDWVAQYYAGLEPVRLGTLVVAPTHTELTLAPGGRPLWLDPGMAFGTGHHETTRLALRALEALDLRGARVLDVGAGSGILAIGADLLGAAGAVGVDIDAATVPVARANARLNRSRARFEAGGPEAVDGSFEVVVANLYAELHAELMPAYLRACAPGGRVLLTGILAEREALVEAAVPDGLRADADPDGGWHRDGAWSLLPLARP